MAIIGSVLQGAVRKEFQKNLSKINGLSLSKIV